MKEFVFSLRALLRYKQTLERLQKAELSQAQAELRALEAQLAQVFEEFERCRGELGETLRENKGVIEALVRYDGYFRHLNTQKKLLLVKIKRAEERRDKCMETLIVTMKEIKAYKKLNKEQYLRYLKEAQAEEEKNMGDLISFDASREEDGQADGTDG